MARRRTIKSISDLEREECVRNARALHDACVRSMSGLRTDSPDYPPLRDLALAISDALGKLTGNPTPWYTPTTTTLPERS
ncbi:MAG: hypothetical protein ABIF45_17330 [Pseudomonadota bacterium]